MIGLEGSTRMDKNRHVSIQGEALGGFEGLEDYEGRMDGQILTRSTLREVGGLQFCNQSDINMSFQ